MKNLLILVVLVICTMIPCQVFPEQGKIQPSAKMTNDFDRESLSSDDYNGLVSIFHDLDKQQLIDAIQLKRNNWEVDKDTAKLLAVRVINVEIFSQEFKYLSVRDKEILGFLFPEFSNYDEFAWFEKKDSLKQLCIEMMNKIKSKIFIMKFCDDATVYEYDFEKELLKMGLVHFSSDLYPTYRQTSLSLPTISIGNTYGVFSRMEEDYVKHYVGVAPNVEGGYAGFTTVYGSLYVKPDIAKKIKDKLKTGWEMILLSSYCKYLGFAVTHVYAFNKNLGKVVFAASCNYTMGTYHLSPKTWTKTNLKLDDFEEVEIVVDNIPSDVVFKVNGGDIIKRSPPNKTLCGKEAIRIYGERIRENSSSSISVFNKYPDPIVLQASKECDVNLMVFCPCYRE